ncbi:hypothetical protein ALC57_00193, partial [Trachymyrmex cornetzi]
PVLDDIFRIKFCPLEPIYVVNYLQLPTSLESKFGRLQCDPYFSEYVELFKRMFLAKEPKDVPTTERDRDKNIQYSNENSNEGKLFDACLYENSEDYEKRITTELLDKTNAFTYQNRHEREKISLSRDYQSTIYPTKRIKPNFIVDLMDTPGDFIPIGSPCSKLYGTIKTVTYSILLLETDLLL